MKEKNPSTHMVMEATTVLNEGALTGPPNWDHFLCGIRARSPHIVLNMCERNCVAPSRPGCERQLSKSEFSSQHGVQLLQVCNGCEVQEQIRSKTRGFETRKLYMLLFYV